MNRRLTTSVIALCAASATPVMAEVTAADVFANQQALMGSMGMTLSGDVTDNQLIAPEVNAILPQGLGSFQISTDATIDMVSNSDGTVTITYPSPMDIKIAGAGFGGQDSFEATATMTHDGYTITASGNVSDITYSMDAENVRIDANDVSLNSAGIEDVDLEGYYLLSSYSAETQVTVGNLVTYVAQAEIGETSGDFTISMDNIVSTNTQSTQPMTSNVSATLPVGGSDIMNLSAALRDGLSFSVETATNGTQSSAETTLNGDILNSQKSVIGSQVALVAMNEDGLIANGVADGVAITFRDELVFPGDLNFGAETMSVNYDIPLNASEESQDFRVATSFKGLTLGDEIWNLFDPAGQLPRDPAEVSFDVTGSGINGMDLLDFVAWTRLMGPPDVQVDDLTIENLRIAAVGAELTAQGAMTFDWTDMQTIPGIARPEGQVTVNLNGANALMDTLAAMGIFPEEELMMPRMMLGMFATPVGDDMLESVLEVNDQGHVLANGQRLQ